MKMHSGDACKELRFVTRVKKPFRVLPDMFANFHSNLRNSEN